MKARQEKASVCVAAIETDYGTDVWAFRDSDTMVEFLTNWAREWWDEYFETDAPEDDDKVYEIFWEQAFLEGVYLTTVYDAEIKEDGEYTW